MKGNATTVRAAALWIAVCSVLMPGAGDSGVGLAATRSSAEPEKTLNKPKAAKAKPAADSGQKPAATKPPAKQDKAMAKPKRAQHEEMLVLRLEHGSAESVAKHVQRLFGGPDRVRISDDEAHNVVLVRAEPQLLEQVRRLIGMLEEAAAQHVVQKSRQVRAVKLEYADAADVGKMLLKLAPFGRGIAPPRIEVDRRTNSLLINAAKADWPAIQIILESTDVDRQ